jgi:hypothetical protein
MKKISTVIIFIFLAATANSQTADIKDSNIIFTSKPINIIYSPTDLITKISIATKKFANGKQGIEFSFITKETENKPEIRTDSIILNASDFKTLTINHPYRNNEIATFDGGYFQSAIHWLSISDIDFIKKETITKIVLSINKKPLVIDLNKKSQTGIKKLADSDY